MKKQDFLFIFVLVIIFLPFFVSEPVYDWYKSFNAAHGMVMSFIKFGILATLGEMLGLRISAGVYNRKGFGVLPRAVVWGLLGMGINAAMIIFSKGVPQFMEYMGMANAAAIINGEFCFDKLWIAFAISVAMNTIFAPVFMTFHMHFGLFYVAEFVNLFIVAGVAATIFLGGWMPLHISGWEGFNAAMDYIPGFVWFFGKAFFVVWLLMWIKWTFPRLRIDQILTLEWKYLVPIGLANLLLMVVVVVFKLQTGDL